MKNLHPNKLLLLLILLSASWRSQAQTDNDAIMMEKNAFCAGAMYTHSSWKSYWEGTLKRTNENIGTITTRMIGVMGNYGIIVCWDTKYYYFNPRPTQLNAKIKTLTGIPNFPAYISGHSTFSAAAATILGHIIPGRKQAYDQMANEASMSRLVGGIHYRADCEMGSLTGKNIGNYAVLRATTDGAE